MTTATGVAGRADGLRVPEELSARVPAEQRGPRPDRDDVRLLVVARVRRGVAPRVPELPGLLRAGDLLVVNTSRDAARRRGRAGRAASAVVVHFSTRGDDGRWAVELREPGRHGAPRARVPGGPAGAVVRLPGGGRLVLEEPLDPGGGPAVVGAGVRRRTCRGCCGGTGGRSATRYTERDQPLSAYQTVFALPSPDGSGSAEMPSAARPFTARLVAELVSRGVQFAPVTLHTGVASAEAHEPPYPERFAVPAAHGAAGQRRAGRRAARVVAVGHDRRAGRWSRRPEPDGVVRAARGLDGPGGDAGARGAGGGRAADRAARAGGLASADAGGDRGAGGARAAATRRRCAGATCGTSSATCISSCPDEGPHAEHCSSNSHGETDRAARCEPAHRTHDHVRSGIVRQRRPA